MAVIDYKAAGVDIAAGNEAVRRIKKDVETTFTPNVLTGIGNFAAMYDLKPIVENYQHPVLVQSIDGVGTKMMVAKMLSQYQSIGIDLVSATCNDIIVLGARPLTLLDYIANDKLDPLIVEQIVRGIAIACRANGVALVGGETAEMPGTYLPGEHDLVGIVTGVVEKEKAILGNNIAPGDCVLALPSSGLHTNGFSLVRKLLFTDHGYHVESHIPEFGHTLGEELLTPHINYTLPILDLLASGITIKGMAHITGGGVLENIPRVLPAACSVEINKNACPKLAIFDLLVKLSQLSERECYTTFNMGVGMVLIVAPDQVASLQQRLSKWPGFHAYEIGHVVKGNKSVRLVTCA